MVEEICMLCFFPYQLMIFLDQRNYYAMDEAGEFTSSPAEPVVPKPNHLLDFVSALQSTEQFSDLRIVVSRIYVH